MGTLALIIVGLLAAGYIWLGVVLTMRANDKYGYSIWNIFVIIFMFCIMCVWIVWFFESISLIWAQIITGCSLALIWMKNVSKTSFFLGTFVTTFQASMCMFFLMFLLMSMFRGSGGSSSKR